MISAEDSQAIIQFELAGAFSWAKRHGIALDWLPEVLEIRAVFIQPTTNHRFFTRGRFTDYKEQPPAWNICNEAWEPRTELYYFPKQRQIPGKSPLFIQHNNNGVICAPFNRLAYATNTGPHNDWGNLSQWQTAAPNQIHATTIGDMVQAFRTFVNLTEGRMNETPP